eukprot:symbB.v1.2.017646.t1/scaffold1373.1/size231899/11
MGLEGSVRKEEPTQVAKPSLGEKWRIHEELMEKGFQRLAEVEGSSLLDQCIRISERALRKVLESADMKYRQMDMEKPKVVGILSIPGILEIFGGAGWVEEDYWLVLHEGTPLESAAQAYRRSSGAELRCRVLRQIPMSVALIRGMARSTLLRSWRSASIGQT